MKKINKNTMYNNEERNNKDERPGMGEFYGGDKIKLTPVTNKQKFNRYHKPFSGKGEQLNEDYEVINDLPTYMLPSDHVIKQKYSMLRSHRTPAKKKAPSQTTREGRIEILKAFYNVVKPTIAIDLEYTVDACETDNEWEALLVKLKNKYDNDLNSNGLKKQSWYKDLTKKEYVEIQNDNSKLQQDNSKLQQEISHLKKIIRESNKDIKSLQNEVINFKKVNTSIIRKSNKDIESLEENQRILLNNQSIFTKEELLSLITTIRENKNTNDVGTTVDRYDTIRAALIDMSSLHNNGNRVEFRYDKHLSWRIISE